MTPAEVAQVANVSLSTVRREIHRGALAACHVGRQLRIERDDFRAYLDRGGDTPCRIPE
jgi:excisionase family DNA binding protein